MLYALSHGFNGREMFSAEVRAGYNKSVHFITHKHKNN